MVGHHPPNHTSVVDHEGREYMLDTAISQHQHQVNALNGVPLDYLSTMCLTCYDVLQTGQRLRCDKQQSADILDDF